MIRKIMPLFYITIPIILLDQLSKMIVEKKIELYHRIPVIKGVLDISHVTNDGAAFGIIRGRNWLFVIITFVAIGFVIFYFKRFQESSWMRVSLGFLLGGAIGNLIDRIRNGYVTDFINFNFWPTFNVADIAVSIGAFLLMFYMLRYHENGKAGNVESRKTGI